MTFCESAVIIMGYKPIRYLKFLDPYSKNQSWAWGLNPSSESQGCQPNICFLLNPCIKRKQMFGWHSCDSKLGFNPHEDLGLVF